MTMVLALLLGVLLTQVVAQEESKPQLPTRKPGHVLIQVYTIPSYATANVFYGRKKLGKTPLVVQFRANSGPVDMVLKRGGYFSVNTRANTFRDDKLMVKMTPSDQGDSLFGFKEELPPDGGPDGGAVGDGGVASSKADAGVAPPKADAGKPSPAKP
jgi:hypothetical protein